MRFRDKRENRIHHGRKADDAAQALRRAAGTQAPKTLPGALGWLWRIYALIKSLFSRDLPELKDIDASTDADGKTPFVVLAWGWEEDVTEYGPDGEPLAAIRRPAVIDVRRSYDPADVDTMIVDLATKYPRHTLTLAGPGIALRLNRRARRAALARVRRAFRREERADLRAISEGRRRDRQARDRARRAEHTAAIGAAA